MSKYYENLEVNVEAIYNAIRSFDKEYEDKLQSKNSSSYFVGEAIDKATELDHKMVLLKYSDKERLAKKIDDAILTIGGGYATSVMAAFYEGIHYYVPATIKSFRVKEYKRKK